MFDDMSRGRFYVRLESREWPLIEGLGSSAPFDAAVISDRYLAPYPSDDPNSQELPDRLARAVLGVGRTFSVDPDTARLEHPSAGGRQSARSALRPVAGVLPLPLTAEALQSPAAVRAFVGASQIQQLMAGAFSAPYLEVRGPDDPRLRVNIELLKASREVAGGKQLIAYLQFLPSTLASGDALRAGLLLVPHANVVVVRARRLEPSMVRQPHVGAWVDLVARLTRAGARVVVDCAGVAGPPLVAAGADAFSAGTRFFRNVAADLHPTSGGGGGEPLRADASLTSLRDASAEALVPADNSAIRVSNLRVMRDDARLAARLGTGYGDLLRRAGSAQGQVWATELQRLRAEAA